MNSVHQHQCSMRFHSQFAKIHPGRGKGLVIVVLCLLLICVLAWIYYAYHIIQGDDPTSSIFSHLESYNAESSNDYRKRVSGLIYKKEESVEGVEDLNFFTLGELFEHWPPNNVAAESWHSSKAHPSNGQHVHRFDYSDPVQKDLASKYREREVLNISTNISTCIINKTPPLCMNSCPSLCTMCLSWRKPYRRVFRKIHFSLRSGMNMKNIKYYRSIYQCH